MARTAIRATPTLLAAGWSAALAVAVVAVVVAIVVGLSCSSRAPDSAGMAAPGESTDTAVVSVESVGGATRFAAVDVRFDCVPARLSA